MKKLSCFALVLALVLAAGSAFAMTTSNASKLAPYDTTAEYDMFTISADYWDVTYASGAYKGVEKYNWATNKSIKSPDIVGLAFYLAAPDFWSDTAFKLGAYDTATTPTKANLGQLSRFWSPDWYSLLLRTTMAASGQGNDQSIKVPFQVFISDDLAKSYWIALSGDADDELECTYPCCGVNFNIDCCAPGEYADLTPHTLKIWFDDPYRVAVYCCPGVPFTLVEALDGDNKIASADRMSVPFTVARLNEVQNMIRVRVDTNFRGELEPVSKDWDWYDILHDGRYSDSDLCHGSDKTFWPWKDEFVCMPDEEKYYWKYRTDIDDFWKDKAHIELADIRLGETFNLGVWYGGANLEYAEGVISPDSHLCVCETNDECSNLNNRLVPRINIQNLGVERLNVIDCHEDPEDYGICAADCGLCDTLSFDLATLPASIGYQDALYKTPTMLPANEQGAYDGIYGMTEHTQEDFVTAAFRWGDFWHIKDNSLMNDDIITIHCPCYIYPSFTKTVQPMANADFVFKMTDGGTTTIQGRWNTSYFTQKLTSDQGSLCSPECSFLYVYYPCGCEKTVVVSTLEKNLTSLIGKTFVNEVVSFDNPYNTKAYGDVQLEGARNVTNDAADADATKFDGLVLAAKTAEPDMLWYNVFKVSEWDIKKDVAKTSELQGILPVQLRFELDYDKISGDIDVNTAGWRDLVWEKLTLKARGVDGATHDISKSTGIVDYKAALDKQAFVSVLPVDEIKTTGHVTTTTKLYVYLTVFMVDGPAVNGEAFHYFTTENGNKILFVFDGKHDDVYENILYVAKPSTTCTFNVSGATTFFVGESTTLTANCLGSCIGLLWTLSSDVAEISGDATGASVVVKGLTTGTATIHVDSCANSADVVLTVTTPTLTPTPTAASGGSSSGGCNAGAFAPLALLLIAPVVLLLKK